MLPPAWTPPGELVQGCTPLLPSGPAGIPHGHREQGTKAHACMGTAASPQPLVPWPLCGQEARVSKPRSGAAHLLGACILLFSSAHLLCNVEGAGWHFQVVWFPCGSDGKASVYNVGDPSSIPGLGRSPGEGNGNPLQYYCLENLMARRAW